MKAGAWIGSAILVAILACSTFANANISVYPSPMIVNSQGPYEDNSHDISLDSVNLTLDLFEDHIEGHGTYVFKYLGASAAKLTLFFDPSYYPRSSKILIDGIPVQTRNAVLEENYYKMHRFADQNGMYSDIDPYNVTIFDITVPANSSKSVQVEWQSGSSTVIKEISGGEYRDFLEKDKSEMRIKNWATSYLVLSNSSWPRPITNFEIEFVSHTLKFDDPLIGMSVTSPHDTIISDNMVHGERHRYQIADGYKTNVSFSNGTNGYGLHTFKISIEDWYEGDSMIVFQGVSEHETIEKTDTYYFIELGTLIIGILLIVALVSFVIYRIINRFKS
jgi:hypothetical protein